MTLVSRRELRSAPSGPELAALEVLMPRIAIVADSHFCIDSRFDECIRIHQWIAEDMARRGVDLILHAGDVLLEVRGTT